MHRRHFRDIRANKPSATEWLDQLPKQNWVQCFDEGKRWGHMTINLSESVNFMLKNTRHLRVSLLIKETYFKTAQLFVIRGQQTQAMINSDSQYSEVLSDAMNSSQQESNTHCKWIRQTQSHFYFNRSPIPTSNTQTTWKV